MSRRDISNKLSVEFAHGRIIRWRKRRFVVVDCTGFEAIIAREVGKRRLERIPVAEAQPDHSINLLSRRPSGKRLSGNSPCSNGSQKWMESRELGPLWRRSLKSSKSIPLHYDRNRRQSSPSHAKAMNCLQFSSPGQMERQSNSCQRSFFASGRPRYCGKRS